MNNKDLHKKLKDIAAIKLDKEEKDTIRAHLINFMEDNPVRNLGEHRLRFIRRLFYPVALIRMTLTKPVAAVIALFIALGSGTTLAAQNSIPGDLLYGYKIHVNENLRAAIAFSSESKAKLAFDLAEERLEEAEKLAAKGSLTAKQRVNLQAKFNEQTSNGHDNLAKLTVDEEFELVSDIIAEFESDLQAHEELLGEIKINNEEETAGEIEFLIDDINLELKITGDAKSESNVKAAAEGKLKAAENKLEAILKFFEKKKVKIDAETQEKLEAELDLAISLIGEGKTQLESENFADAFVDFQEAQQTAQRTHLLLDGEIEFGVDESETEAEAEIETEIEVEAEAEAEAEAETELELDTDLEAESEVEAEAEAEFELLDDDLEIETEAETETGIELNLN